MYQIAIERLGEETEETLQPSSARNCKELNMKTTFELMQELEEGTKRKSESLLDMQRRKIAEQIRLSTT